jgi:NTP pyrophosphatase (non-canonical NTP hydrolase)
MSFKLIENWRKSVGLPVRTSPVLPSEAEKELSLRLIDEEVTELKDALAQEKPSVDEIADAIGDLYFVVTQMANIFGLSPDEIIQKVYDSNMTKIITNEIDADKTIQAYKAKGVDCYYIKLDNGNYIVKRMSDNKVLKSIKFKEPNWSYDKQIARD